MAKEILCVRCGTKAKPKMITKGSILIEIILWCLFIVPGIIYSIWRHATRYKACPVCNSSTIIPLNSPAAQVFQAGGLK